MRSCSSSADLDCLFKLLLRKLEEPRGLGMHALPLEHIDQLQLLLERAKDLVLRGTVSVHAEGTAVDAKTYLLLLQPPVLGAQRLVLGAECLLWCPTPSVAVACPRCAPWRTLLSRAATRSASARFFSFSRASSARWRRTWSVEEDEVDDFAWLDSCVIS